MIGGTIRNYRNPFTAAQWEEFEQQALIYKYMLAGVPVPSHLLYTLKRNLDYSPTLVLPTTRGGWGGVSYVENEMVGSIAGGCMNYGTWGDRRIDPEPGRCRRTDGKKWRCSKEAHPDSKYCERHMHRGRNKTSNSCSRKPVEFQFNTTTTTTTTSTIAATKSSTLSSSCSYSTPLSSSALSHDHHNNPLVYPNSLHHPHSSSSASRHPTHHQHFINTTTMAYSQHDKGHRYQPEIRDLHGENERALFTETAGSVRGLAHDSYYTTLKMDPSHQYFNFHNLIDKSKQQEEGQQHCYVLGTDIKSAGSTQAITQVEEIRRDQENQNKPFHHFFSDWPPSTQESSRDSTNCIDDSVGDQSNKHHAAAISTSTQLSVSMPLSTQDFFQSKPTPYW